MMTAGEPATQGARASAATVLSPLSRNMLNFSIGSVNVCKEQFWHGLTPANNLASPHDIKSQIILESKSIDCLL